MTIEPRLNASKRQPRTDILASNLCIWGIEPNLNRLSLLVSCPVRCVQHAM
jgi:hypothetical protein